MTSLFGGKKIAPVPAMRYKPPEQAVAQTVDLETQKNAKIKMQDDIEQRRKRAALASNVLFGQDALGATSTANPNLKQKLGA